LAQPAFQLGNGAFDHVAKNCVSNIAAGALL